MTSGLNCDCFLDISSLPFSNVTAPKAPYCPFITGLTNTAEDEDEEGNPEPPVAGGATKQRSKKPMEDDSPSTTADEDDEEEAETFTVTPLLASLPATGLTAGK